MRPLNIDSILMARQGDLLVINKPSGLPTSGRTLEDEDCLQYPLIKHFGRMVWALHQLDADTSGLCLFALRKSLVSEMKQWWGEPAMSKEYLAIAHGSPPWDQCEERSPIGKFEDGRLDGHPDGKHAHTDLEVLDRSPGFCLLRARLHTGRTHQIRIHLSHQGHPLVGEEWYRQPPCTLHPRQALHAHRLQFPENANLPAARLTAPLPADLRELVHRLGLKLPTD